MKLPRIPEIACKKSIPRLFTLRLRGGFLDRTQASQVILVAHLPKVQVWVEFEPTKGFCGVRNCECPFVTLIVRGFPRGLAESEAGRSPTS